jgi:hypothetical protein
MRKECASDAKRAAARDRRKISADVQGSAEVVPETVSGNLTITIARIARSNVPITVALGTGVPKDLTPCSPLNTSRDTGISEQ